MSEIILPRDPQMTPMRIEGSCISCVACGEQVTDVRSHPCGDPRVAIPLLMQRLETATARLRWLFEVACFDRQDGSQWMDAFMPCIELPASEKPTFADFCAALDRARGEEGR